MATGDLTFQYLLNTGIWTSDILAGRAASAVYTYTSGTPNIRSFVLADRVVLDPSGDGLMLGSTAAKTLGFFGATPAAQPASATQAFTQTHGAAYDATGATTTIGVAGTYYRLDNTTTAGPVSEFTHAANKLTYTGAATVVCLVSVTLTAGYAGGAGAKTLGFAVHKDGVVIPGSTITRAMSAATDRGAIAFQALVSLATNNYVEVFCTNVTDTQGVVVDRMYITVTPTGTPTLTGALRSSLVTLGLIKGSA